MANLISVSEHNTSNNLLLAYSRRNRNIKLLSVIDRRKSLSDRVYRIITKQTLCDFSAQATYIKTIPTLFEISINDFHNISSFEDKLSFNIYDEYIKPPYKFKVRRIFS